MIITGMLLFTALTGFSQADSTAGTKHPSGYYGRATAGVLAGEYSNMSFQFANGFRLGQTEIGLGLGYESYYGSRFAPMFLESRYHFLRKKSTQPFVGVSAAYLASLNQSYYYNTRNGYSFGGSIGITHYFTKHVGVSSSIGYRYIATQEQQQYMYLMYPPTIVQREMHRLELRVGIVFR